jgi:2-(1,2-epoxy-1,2-dihydrophenyl)acetyl-CoA isomerase
MSTPAGRAGIDVTRDDSVLRIELNRPEKRNALDGATVEAIVDCLENASTDDTLRAILISGRGDHFCSGADWDASNAARAERPRTGSLQRRTPLQAHRIIELLMSIQLPVVAAVRGWAAGLGCQIALAADFAIATESSRFWEPFVSRGFSADGGATWIVPRLIGVARAREFLMLGRAMSGLEAVSTGLIHRAVPDPTLDLAVEELLGELTRTATVALGLTKQCINRSLQSGLTEAMQNESFALEVSSRSLDFKEGLLAFRENRPPDFGGR